MKAQTERGCWEQIATAWGIQGIEKEGKEWNVNKRISETMPLSAIGKYGLVLASAERSNKDD